MVGGRNIALFIHILGVVVLFASIGVTQLAGERVRSAATLEQVRLWLGLAGTAGPMFGPALLVILGSGVYMTNEVWGFDTPWVVVAIASVVVMAGVGGGVVGRGLTRLEQEAAEAGSLSEVAGHVGETALWVIGSALAGMALGVLWLMTTKPGYLESSLVVGALTLLGAALTAARRPRPAMK